MIALDFNATSSGACREFGQWLYQAGYTATWQAYHPVIRDIYAGARRIPDETMAEIERVMADPWFGVPE
jgi:hypothetical protein